MNVISYLAAGVLAFALFLVVHTGLKWSSWMDYQGTWYAKAWKPIQTWTALAYAAGCLVFGPIALAFSAVGLCVTFIVTAMTLAMYHERIGLNGNGWWTRPALSWFKQ